MGTYPDGPFDFAWTDQSFQIDNWNEPVIYEMHLSTFPGAAPDTFDQPSPGFDHLVELGTQCGRTMPINESPAGCHGATTQAMSLWKKVADFKVSSDSSTPATNGHRGAA